MSAVLLDKSKHVALITFNRPEAMNTFTGPMLEDLSAAYKECDADDDVRVVVTTGAGKAYCAGADLSGGDTFAQELEESFSSTPLAMQAYEVRKPVIAACNGHAVGVGLSVAMQADIRFFAEQAKYGFLQSQRGVIADFGVHHILPRLIGLEAALEMLMGGNRYTGQEAYDLGMARYLLSTEEVLPAAMVMAENMAVSCAPLITGMAKRLTYNALDQSLDQAVADETKALAFSMTMPDGMEGGMAFFEKRAPQWQGAVNKDWPNWLK